MRYLIVLGLIFSFITVAFAQQKVFYDPTINHFINADVNKTRADFPNLSYSTQEVIIDETFQGAKLVDGILTIYDWVAENKEICDAELRKKGNRKNAIKIKLKLSDSDWDNLVGAIKGDNHERR